MKHRVHKYQRYILPVLVVATLVIYSNTLKAPFYLDDEANIVENPFVRLTTLSFDKLRLLAFNSPCPNRPVANVSFGLNYLVHEYDPTGYHIVNTILHIANGILLYFFALATLRAVPGHRPQDHDRLVASLTALIWLVHPLHTQSVTYVVQRMNSMATLFFLLSLLSYIKGRRAIGNSTRYVWIALCVLSWMLALGSKEIAAALPIILVLYEWTFFQHGNKAWIRHNRAIWAGALVVIGFATLAFTDFSPFRGILSGYSHRDFTLLERILTQFRVVAHYAGQILYPHPSRLSLLHDFEISRSFLDPPSTLLCAAGITATVVGAFRYIRKAPVLAFTVLWFFGCLLIESSVVSLEIIFEHRTYLPSMLVCLSIVSLTYRFLRNRALAGSLLCIVIVAFSFWTVQRNQLWSNDVAFWKDCTTKAPNDVRAYHSLATALLRKDRIDEATLAYKEALAIDPTYVKSLIGLGHAFRKKHDIGRAIAVHKRAVKMAPKNGSCHNHLGASFLAQNKLDLALKALKKAISLSPYDYRAYNNLGLVYAETGNVSGAVRMYEEALDIRPDFASAYNNLGNLYLNPKNARQAAGLFRKALTYDPEFADAHSNLGIALMHIGRPEQGIDEIKTALRLEPEHKDATFNLARAYELSGRYEQAIAKYRQSIYLNPRDVDAHFNAGFIYHQHLGMEDRAVTLFKQGLSIDPHHHNANKVAAILKRLGDPNQTDA